MNKDNLKASSTTISLFVILMSVLPLSLYVNRIYDDSIKNIVLNFSIPYMILFISLFIKGIKKAVRIPLIIFGLVWVIYLGMHYLIGFHNPFWGN